MSKIVSVVQANDWFYAQSFEGKLMLSRVVVWQTFDNGETIGLISFVSPNNKGQLVQTPKGKGVYCHWDDLTEEQRLEGLESGLLSLTDRLASDY